MKKISILIIFITGLTVNIMAQIDCTANYYVSPTITPAEDPVAISTKGWIYDSTQSIEFDSALPYNNWHISESFYVHGNANNGWSNDTVYWDTISGTLQLHLRNDTCIYEYPPDTFAYTAGILVNNDIDTTYGYFETKVKLPIDVSLCTSFWGWDVNWPTAHYREIDIFELDTFGMHSNTFHQTEESGTFWGGHINTDSTLFNSSDWYIFGCEWLPKTYRFYMNHHFIGMLDYDNTNDCTEDYFTPIRKWQLWIVNSMWSDDPTGGFPKTLQCEYIRIYTLNEDSINVDFYDSWTNYSTGTCKYGVWKTVKLGDAYSATINDNGRHAVWATDGITLDKNFEVAVGTEFETKTYKK